MPYLYDSFIFELGIFSNTINYAVQVYYYTTYAQLTSGQIATVTLVFGIISVAMAWVTDRLMQGLSKRAAWIIAVGLEGIVLVVMVGFIIQPATSITMIYILAILMSLGNAAVYQVPWAMIPDCVDVHELKTGKRIDGVIFGLVAFVQKAAGALGAALLGTILSVVGYDAAAAVQNAEALDGIKNVYGFLVGGLYLIAVLIAFAYPLSKERHERVCEAVAERKEGKDIDLAEFKDLI